MNDVARVVMVNDYDLAMNLHRHHEGRYARHLLFGLPALVAAGCVVRLTGEGGRRQVLRRRAPRTVLANLRTMRAARGADVVYSSFSYGALLAGAVPRRHRGYRVVTVVHGLPAWLLARPRLLSLLYRGHDHLLFLSPAALSAVSPHLRPDQDVRLAPWGPLRPTAPGSPVAGGAHDAALLSRLDLPVGPFAVSVGKSKRDWATLAEANDASRFALVVVGGDGCPLTDGPHRRVLVPPPGRAFALDDDELAALYRTCAVVVLPLLQDDSLAGVTALLEALATARRVVVTGTRGLLGVDAQHPGWVRLVAVADSEDLAAAVTDALSTSAPTTSPDVPDIRDFEQVLLQIVALGRT